MCYICMTDQEENKLIICDNCGVRICHTYCDDDLLDDSVPTDDWFCHDCRENIDEWINQTASKQSLLLHILSSYITIKLTFLSPSTIQLSLSPSLSSLIGRQQYSFRSLVGCTFALERCEKREVLKSLLPSSNTVRKVLQDFKHLLDL